MNDYKKTLVEEDLSPDLIYAVGVYVQLCARIEKLVIKSLCIVQQGNGANVSELNAQFNRRTTKELISSLKIVTEKLQKDHPWHDFFNELRPYLHRYVNNRHMVIHGVICQKPELNVLFFDKETEETLTYPIDENAVQEMVSHADHIARALIRFCNEQTV